VLLLGLFGYPQQLAHDQHSEIWWAVAVLVTAFGLAGATLLISRRREHPSRKVISVISCTALLAVVIFILAALHFAIGTPVPW
jgi:drug/metabolite transporter (DMT)-like permease